MAPDRMEEECRRAQEDEKLVILAIYEREAQFEKNAWKVWKPLSVTIHLEPSDSASRSGTPLDSVDLTVNCPAKYPQEVPAVLLSNPKGISKEMIAILQGRLLEKCKELVGTPMILELCSLVRDFLYENASPVKGSFHDNMVKNQEEKKNQKQRQRLDSEIRDLEQVAAIVKEREQHNLEEREGEQQKPKSFLEDATIKVVAGKTIAVKSSNFKKRQRPHGNCSEWIGVYQNEEVLVSEWNFKFTLGRQAKKKESDFREFLKKLDEVEAYMKQFPTLTGLDQTIVPYLFCHVDRRSLEATNLNVTVSIGQKVRESEQSLPAIINSIKHEPNICRRLAGHAVCALRWLHEMGFAHGAVTANCFWVSDNSFRLSDAGTLSSLFSLSDVFQKCLSGGVVTVVVEEKQSRKRDLFALGTMVDGIRLHQASSNSTAGRDEELTKFITACQSAKSVEELLNMAYLKVEIGAAGSGSSRFGTWQIPDNCRLMNEFITMKLLGSGGFGEVLLARNKIDDSNYAIKRIPLYAKSEKLNRRITREAKLFAKLTHPNVVRYYSAWIENTEKIEASAAKKASPGIKRDKSNAEDSLLPTRLRNLAENVKSIGGGDTSEWSSFGNGVLPSVESSSDEEGTNGEKMLFDRGVSEDEDLICFEGTGSQGFSRGTEESSTEKSSETPKKELSQTPLTVATEELSYPNRLLYIQMEFCDHGTLRSFIDNQALVGNPKTIWRIFREILSGLSYIHRQNMIHRDIKPMNILLDEEDRVKIGDFGLATRDFFRKMDSDSAPLEVNSKVSGQTKDIGTELYMAPELFDTTDPAPYSSKIDVYSTGVVLFEMFYKPLLMGMERLSTLKTLKKNISFPEDYGHGFPKNQVSMAKNFITKMLQSKAENRPSVEELLEDERIAVDVDDQMLQNLLQKTLKRGSQAQQNLLNTLLNSEISPSQNYCFDINCCQEKIPNKSLHLSEVQDQLRLILSKHCYEPLFTHQLLTAASVQDVVEARQKPVLFLDSKGYPVALPLDLRQNFVRYCCRNDMTRRKRYSMDRVFRSTDGIGLEHPIERWEASVDALGPIGTATILTAELVSMAAEICGTALPQVNFTLKVGHVSLVVAVCRHLNISDEQTKMVLQKLHELSTNSKVFSTSEKTEALSTVIGSRSSASLLASLHSEESFSRFRESFKAFTRSRDEAVKDMSRRALAEIDDVHQILEALEVGSKEMRVRFDASLAYRPATFHDGLVFMIVSETQTKKTFNRAIILGGGRYDSSLVRERHPKDNQPKEPLCLVGCSIALDVIITLRKFHKEQCAPSCSTIICSFSDGFATEKFTLARRLWSKDIPTDIIHESISNFDDLWDQSKTRGIEHVLVVLGKDEVLLNTDGVARKTDFEEAVAICASEFEDEHEILVAVPLSSSKSATTVCPTANFSNCDVKMAIPDRMSFNVRKRVLNSIRNAPPDAIALFSSKGKIEILVTELPKDLVKTISGAVSRTTTIPELSGIFDGLARQYGKSKEDLECLFSFLKQLLPPCTDSVPIIILLRHVDGFHKVIT